MNVEIDISGADYIGELAECPIDIVAGNNDFFSHLPMEKEILLGKYKVLLTHGHYYRVAMGVEDIKREAIARGMDMVMFGHTHRPLVKFQDGLTIINPGSLSYPRQEGRRPSYIILETDVKGNFEYHLEYL